jgi:peptidoglycan DL-endopeptidase CwlO
MAHKAYASLTTLEAIMVNVDLAIAHREKVAQLRTAMLEAARDWEGTAYLYAGNSGEGIDCSHFVYQALNAARARVAADGSFSLQLIDYRSTAAIEASGFFVPVAVPERGDLVMWDSHVGIVTDPGAKRFIGAQTSTGVAEATYATGYWAQRPGLRFLRFYWF